jgi:hypothetical protein
MSPPDPGALEPQHRPQRRWSREKKIGASVVAAAIGLVAPAVILGTSASVRANATSSGGKWFNWYRTLGDGVRRAKGRGRASRGRARGAGHVTGSTAEELALRVARTPSKRHE